ncbi:hypothetical protein [Empedobacter tilapiae]|uniref:Lipoprotein n=1 Tax=Empedobacter tilapiae TaxID=2491114 RepID=A0A4Z1C1B6_9FLAO|nr:hypothetical protein [Empedobacter tilapiae]TGN26171.1 hypothetical protein E4J94_12555 [Empedobacter tilapiae]
MKIIKAIVLILVFVISSCNDNYKKEYYIDQSVKLYELKCEDKFYLTFDKCSCNSIPKNYFIPIVNDSDGFYEFHIKNNNPKIEIVALYSNFHKFGNIEKYANFKTIDDNSYYQDSIINNKNYQVFRGYIK